MSTASLENKIDRLYNVLKTGAPKKTETWVKSSAIIAKTGWNPDEMRRARQYGYVKYIHNEKGRTGFWYLLESLLPVQFVRRKPRTKAA